MKPQTKTSGDTIKKSPHVAAHKCTIRHHTEVMASAKCGCFHCLSVFSPQEIVKWVDGGLTALCPRCVIDSVLPEASGHPISIEFLRQMKAHWFGGAKDDLDPQD
jgi:hypothetical protein